jgi:hypothetical protein
VLWYQFGDDQFSSINSTSLFYALYHLSYTLYGSWFLLNW